MSTTASAERWQRLGAQLIQRRTALYPRHSRGAFSETTGLSYRLVYDIEEARRTNFGTPVIAGIEAAYKLAPGAIGRFLDGAELRAADGKVLGIAQAPPAAPSRPDHQSGSSVLAELSRQLGLEESPEYAALWGRIGLAADQHGIPLDPDAPAAVLKGEWLWPRDVSPADVKRWDEMASSEPAPTLREMGVMMLAVWTLQAADRAREQGGAAGLPPGKRVTKWP
jgi:hypothetical protein